ncbi:hypothetical protein SGR_3999 [Streptomyces griseus subsp. griseus NBRC 13350]|uniref:Uncharacterized protein n=2 Tax=Streptomyces TaxID=1883 RepID=B1VS74_STRGG|nr:hypothetical protein [Streptomyces griseus]NEB55937.1 hypothetical protein [Streptomyces griseus]BAG20828.1 hypothetical protein SGR_3999 [Streptomyces griseus subsp. griseus NBRC 13350]SEE74423.1 hypothetical protein SAMN04490359_5507 [Streptomyces griseus]SQA21759.1 Uncharacterised protein [Streptomyces griseus]
MVAMATYLLSDIEQAIRGSWGAETCTPEYRDRWTPDNPARDQCGVTAMVLNDLLGGELIRGEVHVGGVRTDFHWWNRLGPGVEIDLTREQFGPEETVVGGDVVVRPPVGAWRRLHEEYAILRDRVAERLGREPAADPAAVPSEVPAVSPEFSATAAPAAVAPDSAG